MPQGYAIFDQAKWSDFQKIDFDLKTPADDDVEVSITHCGICGSDLHTVRGDWGNFCVPAVIPGHEIVGTVTSVGKSVQGIKVGDRVGVGAQVGSCMNCDDCSHDNENYCANYMVDTYNSRWPDGSIAQGGYSNAIRAHQKFIFPIPDGLKSEHAAPMLCAGLTVYSPLVRSKVGPGSRVGVIGIGGLGHFGIMFAQALGAEVFAFSHTASKKEHAHRMGANEFILMNKSEDWLKRLQQTPLDVIINTASSSSVEVGKIISCLKVGGHMYCLGLPKEGFRLPVMQLCGRGAFIASSHIGSKKEALDMLNLASEKKIEPWIELLPMKECSKAIERVAKGDVRYRFVLQQDL